MAGNEIDIVSQGEKSLTNRTNQCGMIAPRKIGASDRPFKQNVPNNRQSARRMKKHDMPWRMSRAVNHLKVEITDLNPIPINEPTVGRKGVKGGESKHPTLRRQLVDPECIVPMRSLNRDAMTARVFSRLPAVVDMSMRQHDLDQSATRLRQRLVNGIEIATRVDRGSLTGTTTHDDRTVLGERRYGNDREAKFGTRGCSVNSH
jgi:hypothetical protein